MIFNDLINDQNITDLFQNFPQLKKYLFTRYKNYELKYSNESFISQLTALILEYYPMLINVEKAFELRNTNDLTLDNLGDKQKVSGNQKTTMEGFDSKNYVGYEVLGEFERTNESKNDTITNDQTTTSYNLLDVLSKLENSDHVKLWLEFEKRFIKLFILIYNIMI